MTFRYVNNTSQTTTTGGFGDLILTGTVTGARTFVQAVTDGDFADGDTTVVHIASEDLTEWETTVVTYNAGTGTLARASTPEASSNGGAKVNFTGGTTKTISTVASADRIILNPIAPAQSEVTISGGKITVTSSQHTVDTESDGASDDLAIVNVASLPDGAWLLLAAENTARTVVLQHDTGSPGADEAKLILANGDDYTMDEINKWILLVRRGSELHEVSRSYRADEFPSGTEMLFRQSAAPTGWTKGVTYDNRALRVVTGTPSAGGSVAFSTVFGRTVTDSHTLSTSQIPSHFHTHDFRSTLSNIQGGSGSSYSEVWRGNVSVNTGTQGGGAGHTHNIDLRVQYVDLILATKD